MTLVVQHGDAVAALMEFAGAKWPSIIAAKEKAERVRAALQELLIGGKERFLSDDTSIVVFGSLGRDEWTVQSDLDWTFLVDGQADPEHLTITQEIGELLKKEYRGPGRTGVFGNMAFSHEIIHQIGGQDDTNRNTTQRILLLLESKGIGKREADAHDRVLEGVFNRYLEDDRGLLTDDQKNYRVPRFLLNDIVRFWRTMAVDFARKQRDRAGEGWALRNAKLRMSRKLIFASGLLTCFSCQFVPVPALPGPRPIIQPLVSHLKNVTSRTPLENIATLLLRYRVSVGTVCRIFGSYDAFLSILDDENKRARLQELRAQDSRNDSVFEEIRDISHEFQAGLSALFFDEDERFFKFVKQYGVF